MATVELSRREEATKGELPMVCMCCGEAATGVYRVRLTAWRSPFQSIRLTAALCEVHKNHFRGRSLTLLFGIVITILFFGVGVLLVNLNLENFLSDKRDEASRRAVGLTWLGC